MVPEKIYRHGAPSKLDIAPLGTKCYVLINNWNYEVYEQISHNEESPQWLYLGKEKKE